MKVSRIVSSLTLVLTGLSAISASAFGVNEPPAVGHSVISFPERDFVSAEGYTPGADATVNVIRNGVTIGTAATPVTAEGLVEINHPGGGCWQDITPDIIPGDKIRVTVNGVADQTTTADVAAEPAKRQGNDIVVTGTAQDAAGNQLPLGAIEQRIIAPDLVPLTGRRRLQAPGDGTLTYDAPGSTRWTARYSGFSNEVVNVALAGETRILWLGADPLAGTELTIFEVGDGVEGGPSPPCTAPAARMAVTSLDRTAVNLDNVRTDLAVGGLAFNATSVTLRLSDGARSTDPIVVTPTPAGNVPQTWSAVVPAAQVATLADGRITVSADYTVNNTTLTGVNKTFEKDTVAPPTPTATPGPGRYPALQSVTLSQAETVPTTTIRFTVDGTMPTALSTVFTQPLLVTATQTIRAISLDRAGNRSPIADLPFTIGPITVTGGLAPRISKLRSVCIPMPKAKGKRCRPGVTFVLSTPARVTFVVSTKGRTLGAFARTFRAGKHTVVLPERVGARALGPGTYRLSLRGRLHGVPGTRVTTSVVVPKPVASK